MGTVPNSSERFGTVPKSNGRAPVLTDEELAALAEKLNAQKGKPPSIQELIDASGGCQRQRAVRALIAFRLKLGERAALSQIVFTPAMAEDLKLLQARWLNLAAAQLALRQAQADEATQQKLQAASDAAADQAERIHHLVARVSDVERINQELLARNQQLQAELDTTQQKLAAQTVLANERQRLLDSVLTSTGTTIGEPT